jgi:hypothetical protein
MLLVTALEREITATLIYKVYLATCKIDGKLYVLKKLRMIDIKAKEKENIENEVN